MLSEKDKAVVASMVRIGMSLETLKRSFPQFEASEVERIYEEETKNMSKCSEQTDGEMGISCNCS